MKKRPKRQKYGSSKGRPRKAGQRHPSGEIKRAAPNQLLMARRNALCADPTQSTTPLDCARANGWLEGKDHKTGRQYASIYRACGLTTGSTSASAGQEVDVESELTKLSLSQMSDATICEAWDRIMDRPLKLGIERDGAKLAQWKKINEPLSAVQRQQLYLVCVMESWPQWLVQRLAGRTLRERVENQAAAERRGLTDEEMARIYNRFNSSWERSRDHLIQGLEKVRKALQPASDKPNGSIESLPPPRSRKVAETTRYVDQDGELIREAVRLVPVGTTS